MKANQLKAGSILSYLQIFLGVIVGLIASPITIRALGQSEYGLYNTVASTLAMLSVLSLGFNSSYVRHYAKYKNEGDKVSIYRLNGLFLIIFIVIGVVAFLCGLFLTFNLNLVFAEGFTEGECVIAKKLMLILSVNLALSFPMSVFTSIISANERFIFLKLLGMVKTVLSPIIVIPVLLMGYGSVALALITVGISFAVDVTYLIYVLFVLKNRFYFRHFEKGLFKSLFAFTFFIAINLLVDEINSNIDKVVLGRYCGTVAVAVYSVAFMIYEYYKQFSYSVSNVFAPRIHAIYQEHKDDESVLREKFTSLFIKVGRVQYFILALIFTGLIFFGQPFIALWVGADFAESYYVLLLLVIPITIPLIQNMGIEMQRALNKHKFRSIIYLIMAILNLVATIYLCQIYGVIGATIGTAFSMIIANGIIMNVYYYKQCCIDTVAFWKSILRATLGLVIPAGFGVIIMLFINISSYLTLIPWILAYTLVYCASVWFLGLNQDEKRLLGSFFKKFKGAKKRD